MKPIYTYYNDVPSMNAEDELKLLLLWRENWSAYGFEPVVLNEFTARQHPYFEEFDAAVRKLPTVNPEGYDLACYYRHLAMAQVGGGVLSDYDVFLTRDPNNSPIPGSLTLYEKTTPSLVCGTAEAFLTVCKLFASYQIGERDKEGDRYHCSDQNILSHNPNAYLVVDFVYQYGRPGWESAGAVHFSNGATTPAGKRPRHTHVPLLLPGTQPIPS